MIKKKVINDPVWGFITIPHEFIFDLLSHPFFQRLRRIKQLGWADLVYPGALHTRFHHALGAMHLMQQSLITLRSKDIEISQEEEIAACAAILLHDVGHTPFSHSLENFLPKISHEEVSLLLMKEIEKEVGKPLDLSIRMFEGKYERPFFYQLISSQLDTDRLDYLSRDSFYTGVSEGNVGADRIIKMFQVKNEQLVVEEKGIYSIENFLFARRFMYWQVYLHKTCLAAEIMSQQILKRVKFLLSEKYPLEIQENLYQFLSSDPPNFIKNYTQLDDFDIIYHYKIWQKSHDSILKNLCTWLLERHLFKLKFISKKEELVSKNPIFSKEELEYYHCEGEVSNAAYWGQSNKEIKILTKSNQIVPISEASDLPTIKALFQIVKKDYVSYKN